MRFILKHDTLENWEKVNPVLMEAEIVSVKEDGFYSLALGDGTNPFKKLPRIKLQEGLSLKLDHCGNGRIKIRVIEDISGEEEKILAKEKKEMSDNYAVINGRRIKLTDEQVKALGVETRKNPFERVADGDPYYYIAPDNYIYRVYENYDQCNYDAYYNVNYFNDKDFANQVALHQLLYRKLLKFAYDNKCEDTAEWNGVLNYTYDNTCENTAEWSKRKQHYSVRYSYEDSTFVVFCQYDNKGQDVYFSSEEAAKRAIEEVIKPFMEEHPEFGW